MDNFDKNNKINKHLKLLADEYKSFLISNIDSNYDFEVNSNDNGIEDNLINELYSLDNNVKSSYIEKRVLKAVDDKKSRKNKMLLQIGLIYLTIGGISYLLLFIRNNVENVYDSMQLIALLFTLLGVLISFYSTLNNKRSYGKIAKTEIESELMVFDIIDAWKKLESAANKIYDDNISYNPMLLFKKLLQDGIIDKYDFKTINEFRSIRNNVVHSNNIDIIKNHNTIQVKIHEIDLIVDKINFHFYKI